ncbi:enoyl-CoA hydratase-related protein [Streptomyces sp. CA-249302]|uniref:enoyl-CoA hydratase-related protein n=1 Tax=Streptomyces sp. CA-249302 TaxID=3240058 RepID=UPI003D8F4196
MVARSSARRRSENPILTHPDVVDAAYVPVPDRVLRLDGPDRRNVLSPRMVRDLADAVETCERDETVGAIFLTGAGPAICAGAELGKLLAADRRRGQRPGGRSTSVLYTWWAANMQSGGTRTVARSAYGIVAQAGQW